ncbi:MAG: NUDIX hydrolase [Blautia sp.]|nr:NUDIX hydrolase [Blautia sp.]
MQYLEDITPFLGTGQKNEAGQTLEEFLERYDPKKYDCPSNTVDIAVFRRVSAAGGSGLQLLMIRRRNHPNIGYWALPGGFVEIRENLEDAAARELMEETGVTGISLKQHGAWGDYDRDPRWRVITALYFTILTEDVPVRAGDDAADARWFDVTYEEVPEGENSSRLSLRLQDVGSDLLLEAEARCVEEGDGPLRTYTLTQTTSNLIAGDHGMMILDLLRYIRSFSS